jgi:cobalt-zinc-cadmium efflux system outer membrane protein
VPVLCLRARVHLAVATACLLATSGSVLAQPPGPASESELTLEAVIASALTQHPLIAAARARVEAARGTARQTALWPNIVGTYWLENAAFPGTSPTGLDRESSAYATVPLEPLYQRGPRVAQASQDVAAAVAAGEMVRRQVANDAARAFFRVAMAQASVGAAEENRANLEQLVAFNDARVREGAAPEGDLIRVRVEMDRAATDLVLAEVELTRARGDLWLVLGTGPLTGRSPDMLRVRSPAGGDLRASPAPLAELLTTATTSRPEVLSARARVASATASAEYEGRLSVRQLGGTFGIKNTAGQRSMIAGINVTLPIFDRNQGAVRRATADRVAAEQELTWATRTVSAEIQTSYAAAARVRARAVDVQHTVVERAESARAVALAAYREGATTVLQVIDASRALAEARLSTTRLLLAERQSWFDVLLGSGSDPVSIRIDERGMR